MQFRELYSYLKNAGTAQNVKIYRNHGANGKMFGVSFAELSKLKKKIKVDHELAASLWNTGNLDAKILATMIADPDLLNMRNAEKWLKEVGSYMESNALGGLVGRSPIAMKAFEKWSSAKNETKKHCGYDVLCTTLKNGASLTKTQSRKILKTIESEIHSSPNRAKNAMNMALICIGTYCEGMEKEATDVAKRIGKVEVDHGKTSCKTPDAASYIKKSVARLR